MTTTPTPSILPVSIIRGTVHNQYVWVPDTTDPNTPRDLTSYTVKGELRDKPGGTVLATYTCTKNSAPPGAYDTGGWVKMSIDDGTTIGAGYRGTWSLLAGLNNGNFECIAAGSADIISQATA